jgi:translocation and assembly module TamB
MSRKRRIAAIVGASFAGLMVILFVAGITLVRTEWFRTMVRAKIVSSVEEATGGRVEAGSFTFDWRHLRAQVRDFVVHGLEPAGAAPLLRANLLQVDLKLLSPFRGFVDIAYLLVDTPQANVIVYADGRTNIPAPKIKSTSNKTATETIVDLAIGHFDLRSGSLTLGDRSSELNASGGNLRAQMGYNALTTSYAGELYISPLHVRKGPNAPLDINIQLPLTIDREKIAVVNGQITTAQSKIAISAEMDHLATPHASGHLNAHLALDELRKAAGFEVRLDTAHGPHAADADITASMDQDRIQIESARVTLGQSNLEARGTLQQVEVRSTLALEELGRLLRVEARPEGMIQLAANATLDANRDFHAKGNVEGRGLAFRQGGTRIAGIQFDTAVAADRHRIALDNLRLAALGGTFTGNAALEELAQFQLSGNLRNFDLQQMAGTLTGKPLGYSGVIAGPVQAAGNWKAPSTLTAGAQLAIAPGNRGVPVSGHVAANYDGRSGNLSVDHSQIALPHTQIDLTGSLGKQMQVRLVSRDFADFRPITVLPVTFAAGGSFRVNATATGSISSPRIAAQVAADRFAVDGRPFTSLSAAVAASSAGASVSNGVLSRGTLQAQFTGSVGLHDWSPEQYEPLHVDATIRNGDLRDVLALAGRSDIDAAGTLAADAHIDGTLGSPRGNADLSVLKGSIQGEPFDSLSAKAVLTERAIDVPTLNLVSGASRIDATAHYDHAPNDLERGTLTARVASNQVQLAQFQQLVKDRPGLGGALSLNGNLSATLQPGPSGIDFRIQNLQANASARGLQMQGKGLGDFTATADTAGRTLRYNVHSDFAGSSIQVTGESALDGDHQTSATAAISNLPIDRVLAIAGRTDLPVKGTLGLNGRVSGTLDDPRANVTLNVTNGSAYDEPFNRLQATLNYDSRTIDVPQFRLDDGAAHVDLTAAFTHPPHDFANGQARFHVASDGIQLARVHTLQQREPGLDGALQVTADGAATLRADGAPLFSTLNANVSAKGLSVNKKPMGDLTATAETHGSQVDFNLNSDFAHSSIRGSGRMTMGGDYPLTAQVSFSNLTYSGLSAFLAEPMRTFEASMDGRAEISGPVTNTSAMRGDLRLTKLEAHSVATAKGRQTRVKFDLHNEGDVMAALDRSVVTIENFRVVGPYGQLAITGSAPIAGQQPLNVRVNGNVKLELLEAFDPGIYSEGAVTLNAAVTGTSSDPSIRGALQLQNASFNMLDMPQGISNANGTVQFNGSEAILQNITGQSGGGKVTLAGNITYAGAEPQFRIQATASQVHIEYPSSVTTQVGARLTLAGTESNSLLSGNVYVQDVTLHQQSDVGSILTSAATPPSSDSPSTGILAGMHFDVRVRTASDAQFRTSLAQNLQMDANLTLRGTPDHPGMIGRMAATQGEVVFFGAKYTIDQGTISFYDPQKIEPILNVALETKVQGVEVTLNISGPVERMKLSYHSDPPLEFQQIVSLLAAGKTPTTDPVLAAHTPAAPEQNLEQAGASTLLGQAVANPISGRLTRLFGVSKLSIDPQITGQTNTPQATLTFQQQVTKDITFTYIQDVTRSNSQAIRVEWSISPQFSAVAQRDIYGELDLDFFYKKRFH